MLIVDRPVGIPDNSDGDTRVRKASADEQIRTQRRISLTREG